RDEHRAGAVGKGHDIADRLRTDEPADELGIEPQEHVAEAGEQKPRPEERDRKREDDCRRAASSRGAGRDVELEGDEEKAEPTGGRYRDKEREPSQTSDGKIATAQLVGMRAEQGRDGSRAAAPQDDAYVERVEYGGRQPAVCNCPIDFFADAVGKT